MKRWWCIIVLSVVGVSVQACTAMDGEHDRMQKKPAAEADPTPTERSHEGTQPPANADGQPLVLQSGDAGPAVTSSVECGGNVCSGATPYCCASVDTGTCVGTNTTTCAGDRFLVRCDQPGDCATGEVCCAWWDNTQAPSVWQSACRTAAACEHKVNIVPEQNVDQAVVRMCMTDADCDGGRKCTWEVTNWDGVGVNMKAAFCR